MNRRSFLSSILAAAAAPAIVRADSLMRVVPRTLTVWKSRSVGMSTMHEMITAEMLGACAESLRLSGRGIPMPKNSGDTIVFRRWLPYTA